MINKGVSLILEIQRFYCEKDLQIKLKMINIDFEILFSAQLVERDIQF